VCKKVDGEGVYFGGLLILIPRVAGTTINKNYNKNNVCVCIRAGAKTRRRQRFNITGAGRHVGVWNFLF